jgi:PAS domain S-box-containing protein
MTTEEVQPSRETPEALDERFCAAMDVAPVMVWVSDADKLCIWFNRPWLDFTGRTMAQEIGNGWAEGVHPDDLARCLSVYVESFDARRNFRMQYRLRAADGSYRCIDDTGAPRYGIGGEFLGYTGSCSDIHDLVEADKGLRQQKGALEQRIGETASRLKGEIAARHATEKDLRTSSTQLELLIEGITDCAIYMLDTSGTVSSWNSGAARIKGYTAAEIIGQHFSCFYTEPDRQDGLPARALRVAEAEGKFEAEGWRMRKDGTRFWAHVLIDPIRDETGVLVGFGKVTRDLTDLREVQTQLERARDSMLQVQKMEAVGQLTGGIAHDFNNLLMVIMGNIETAQRHSDPQTGLPSRLQGALTNAMHGARRAATLTQRMLAFSRRQPLAPKTLNLNKFIVGEVEFLQRTLGEDVQVEAVGGAGLWKVEVDVNQLEAALLNLAVNARDAMPHGGKLTIETCNAYLDVDYCRSHAEIETGQYVLLSVTDSGEGMTPEVISRAFEPFYSTKAVGQGTGLGLSQVYGFIRQSGGHVALYSEPGEGTTVKVYLPRCHTAEEAPAEQRRVKPQSGGAGETILVVEDDEDVRAYLIEILHDMQYYVLQAADSLAALEIIRNTSTQIHLLLTDVVLPGMNGRQLAREAHLVRPGLKVLYMTGYSRNAIVHQGRLDHDVELVQKPVTHEHLAMRIRAMLDGQSGK